MSPLLFSVQFLPQAKGKTETHTNTNNKLYSQRKEPQHFKGVYRSGEVERAPRPRQRQFVVGGAGVAAVIGHGQQVALVEPQCRLAWLVPGVGEGGVLAGVNGPCGVRERVRERERK